MMSEAASSHDAHGHGHDEGAVHAHISGWKFLVGIFLALIFLTAVTYGVSYVDLGPANTVVAIAVATMKASLVALFFMHLRYDKLFHGVVFVMAFVFLGLFLMLTLDDRDTRARIDSANSATVYRGEAAPGGMPEPVRPAAPAGGAHAASGEH